MLKKVQNESSNTESSHTIKVNNKENFNTNQKQGKPILMNKLKDCNCNDITTNFFIKTQQLIADECEVTYDNKDITLVHRLGKNSLNKGKSIKMHLN